ncbi:unnamed protein product [Callosobruchus maculatus]|uniref:Uncharacterized protein n=1 Tax=Callosobruchus maculatus TaxID=64391 RepID=A0A653C578_CALMS|nr:unnamed protein product [Callosobruchus maculatus]
MDLAETMKNVLAKGMQQTSLSDLPSSPGIGFPGSGYVTEKLYMLLQLYLQNKGWNPSVELLQCFSELKETSMLPSAAYLQMMASRVTLDSQGRLILRENGKIILPFEHFANAVIENFGMEKEFIIEVVQNCPNPACRLNAVDLTGQQASAEAKLNQSKAPIPPSGPTQQQITAALIQHQNRAMAQQSIDKLNASIEKQQRQHMQQDLLALHNGAWTPSPSTSIADNKSLGEGGQEKIVRAFAEVMKNMSRMKTYVRPAMCKPYGKQSEALQKTLMDTIQLIQSLRSFLPPPHIQVSSWKNEDKHRYDES